MAHYLLARSEGTIGELAHLLLAAALAAVESGENAINQRTLSMADYTGPGERRRQFERELLLNLLHTGRNIRLRQMEKPCSNGFIASRVVIA